jgi:uncharacterized cupin superfamily protein
MVRANETHSGYGELSSNTFSYIVSGHFRTVMDDSTVDELGPGDIAISPPGHDAMVAGDEPCVLFDFQGASRNG